MKNKDKEKQEEIDLAEIFRSIWTRRGFIVRIAAAAVAIGLIVAIFGEVRYTSSTVVVPQSEKSSTGNFQGLAAMAGINLKTAEQGELLSPTTYPMVVGSVPFRRELMRTEITVNGHDAPVTLLAYFTESKYRKFSLFPFLIKYTVGLPGVVMGALRGRGDAAAQKPDTLSHGGITTLTPAENACMKSLSEALSVKVDERNGYVTLSATMSEPLMAAQTAARAQELLQEYVTRFKLQKLRANLDFIEARYGETKADFEAKQRALAAFQDANRDISSAVARTRESRLINERDLAFSIYSELARQREQAGIKVKEDTPTFTVVEPVTVPIEKSAPRRGFIVMVSLFLGLFVGAALALVLPRVAGMFDVKR